MKIHVFYPNKSISIKRSFEPLVCSIKKTDDVVEFELPYGGGNPFSIWKNIWFVWKHRTKEGVNHITGDAHYCILGLLGVPSVLTIHDDYAMRQAHRGYLDKAYKWLVWLKLPIFFARKVVCISPSTYNNIQRYVNSREIYVVSHHCVNENFKLSPKVFNRFCPVVFQIGTLPHKNLETTIKALEGLRCELHVLKQMTDSQKKMAEMLCVQYANYAGLSNEEVLEEYKNADIVVFPSDYEGFGMPIVEAQAMGRVVITTNRNPMNWVAGKDGAIFVNNPKNPKDLREAILKAINNHILRQQCIENGINNVKRFSLESVRQKYQKIYQDAIMSISPN